MKFLKDRRKGMICSSLFPVSCCALLVAIHLCALRDLGSLGCTGSIGSHTMYDGVHGLHGSCRSNCDHSAVYWGVEAIDVRVLCCA